MLGHALTTAAISVAVFFAIALGLIASQRPGPPLDGAGGLDFSRVGGTLTPPNASYTARDGAELALRRAGQGSEALVVALHGSGWHSAQWSALVEALGAVPGVTALAPDLRGHGANPGPRGDVAYIGQLEHDLDDLIAAHRAPGQRVILVGHSSGGGLVVRHAGGAPAQPADATVLLAPYLHHRAPTMRPNSGGWAQPLTRRIIGLSMLNTARISTLNGLTAIQFNMPEAVRAAGGTPAYSFRLNTSYAPRGDWGADVAALPDTRVLVGAEDEAFRAQAFAPAFADHSANATVEVIPGASHLDIYTLPMVKDVILDLAGLR